MRFPELTWATRTAAPAFFSMSTSWNSIPARLSCDFKRTQYPHQRVVNTVGSYGRRFHSHDIYNQAAGDLFRPERLHRIAFVTRRTLNARRLGHACEQDSSGRADQARGDRRLAGLPRHSAASATRRAAGLRVDLDEEQHLGDQQWRDRLVRASTFSLSITRTWSGWQSPTRTMTVTR